MSELMEKNGLKGEERHGEFYLLICDAFVPISPLLSPLPPPFPAGVTLLQRHRVPLSLDHSPVDLSAVLLPLPLLHFFSLFLFLLPLFRKEEERRARRRELILSFSSSFFFLLSLFLFPFR